MVPECSSSCSQEPIISFYREPDESSLYDLSEINKDINLSLCLTNQALCQEVIRSSGGVAPHILDLGTRSRWMVNLKEPPVRIGQEAGRAPETVWTLERKMTDISLAGIRTPAVQPMSHRYTNRNIRKGEIFLILLKGNCSLSWGDAQFPYFELVI
jgi:hypothetical protein